jgi:diguanylate cyclase (GGDEF)-like protein
MEPALRTRDEDYHLPLEYAEELERLRKLAFEDALTGLGNRRAFDQRLAQTVAFANRYGGPAALILADLDKFKRVNDEFGHPVGDELLRRVGRLFRRAVRGADHASRIGGDEFAIILPNTDLDHAVTAAVRLREEIESLLVPGVGSITASFGVAAENDNVEAAELYSQADQRLLQAKRAGRNHVEPHEIYLETTSANDADRPTGSSQEE